MTKTERQILQCRPAHIAHPLNTRCKAFAKLIESPLPQLLAVLYLNKWSQSNEET
jgi:hypothetical protein